jgi:hypothetical protein
MSFENLYMSQSMHELFNKSGAATPEEIALQALWGRSQAAEHQEPFIFEAILAANLNTDITSH